MFHRRHPPRAIIELGEDDSCLYLPIDPQVPGCRVVAIRKRILKHLDGHTGVRREVRSKGRRGRLLGLRPSGWRAVRVSYRSTRRSARPARFIA